MAATRPYVSVVVLAVSFAVGCGGEEGTPLANQPSSTVVSASEPGDNQNPVIGTSDFNGTQARQAVVVDLLADDFDPDDDPLTVVEYQGPGTIESSIVTWEVPCESEIYAYSYSISDGRGGFDAGGTSFFVQGDPVAVDDDISTRINRSVSFDPLSNDDLCGTGLQFVSDPAHGTLTWNLDDSLTYTPRRGFKGIDSFTYIIWDGRFADAAGTVTILVAPPGHLRRL